MAALKYLRRVATNDWKSLGEYFQILSAQARFTFYELSVFNR